MTPKGNVLPVSATLAAVLFTAVLVIGIGTSSRQSDGAESMTMKDMRTNEDSLGNATTATTTAGSDSSSVVVCSWSAAEDAMTEKTDECTCMSLSQYIATNSSLPCTWSPTNSETGKECRSLLPFDVVTNGSSIQCTWSPSSGAECLSLLSQRLPPRNLLQRHNWFFIGDSTMHRLWSRGNFLRKLVQRPMLNCKASRCNISTAERCHVQSTLGFSPTEANSTWIPPGAQEGPTGYGLEFPHCTDCGGCFTNFLSCSGPCQAQTGGYIALEFARDVELQTDLYKTSQENMALFLRRWILTLNTTVPICILNEGIHDMTIPGLTDEAFFNNIRWLLKLLDPVCAHFVWINNLVPLTEDYPQKTPRLQLWNLGVLRILETSPHLQKKATVVDGFAASKTWKHFKSDDNVHMNNTWYMMLGDLFDKLM